MSEILNLLSSMKFLVLLHLKNYMFLIKSIHQRHIFNISSKVNALCKFQLHISRNVIFKSLQFVKEAPKKQYNFYLQF